MDGADAYDGRSWLLAVNCTVLGALDGKEVAFDFMSSCPSLHTY